MKSLFERGTHYLRVAPVVCFVVIGVLEVLSDREGAVVFGWVAEDVHYAQVIEKWSSSLGMRYASRLERQLERRSSIRIFMDCSGVDTYDLCARNACQRVLVAQRQRIASIALLARTRIVQLGAQALAAHLPQGMLQVTIDRAEFVAQLDGIAPLARRYVTNPVAWVEAASSSPPLSIR